MRHRRVASIIAVACGLMVGAPAAQAEGVQVPDGSICVVYDEQVTRAKFDQMLSSARIQYLDNGRSFPATGTAERRILEADLVEYLVSSALVRAAAAQRGLTVSEATVDAARADLVKQMGGERKFRLELERVGTTEEQVREDLRLGVLSKRLFAAVIAEAPKSTDAQARTEFDQHRARYRILKSRVVGHILVRTQARAVSLRALLSGKPFSAFQRVARRYSLDPSSAPAGGRLSIKRGQTVPPFDRVAFALRTGQLSAPVRTTYGWHLIYAISAIQPERQKPFSEVRLSIRKALDAQAEAEHYQTWTTAWRQESAAHIGCLPEHPWSPAST